MHCILVECLREANKILFLDGEGNITLFDHVDNVLKRDDFQRLLSHGLTLNGKISDAENRDLPQSAPPPPPPPLPYQDSKAEKDDSKLKLLKGDTTLYFFYFKSIGKPLFVLWVIVMFMMALTERFPGELLELRSLSVLHT